MPDCDGWFDEEGIPFQPQYQDDAVHAVLSADFYDPPYKKFLIQCWFDTTYGAWNGSRFDLKDSRVNMSKHLTNSGFRTYEQMIETLGGKPPL